jgi:hypothetical protein
MKDREDGSEVQMRPPTVNPHYAAFQIAKALITSEDHPDPATRERAEQRIAKWETVLHNILTGSVDFGSRTPVANVPAWATLEVITGGFATGELLAAGPLQQHETHLLETLPKLDGDARGVLNAHFLTEAGLADLQERLRSSCYDVGVPEEGAFLVVAWLVEKGYIDEARALLDELSPLFSQLRFYPIPLGHPRRLGSRIHLRDVGTTISDFARVPPNRRVLAQKEASGIWAPYYDRIVAMFIETVVDGWPCRRYPEGWHERARIASDDYVRLRQTNLLCGKPERRNGHFAQLREFLRRCATAPESLTGREVGRIRHILLCYVAKHGAPNSPECIEARRRQVEYVSGPTFLDILRVVLSRLSQHPKDEGLDDVNHLKRPVDSEEAANFRLPENTAIPKSIQRKLERCLNETIEVLVEREIITSAETLARLLPQITSEIRAAGISDPSLRRLYAAIYRAFRRRRSLLLLNLEKQVRIDELPWIAAIDRFRRDDLSSRDLAHYSIEEIVLLTITAFPQSILPNKLIRELRALAKTAELDIPLVNEVAADIFMGQFSETFHKSARIAADLLEDSLYARYYGVDYQQIRKIKYKPAGTLWQLGSNTSLFKKLFGFTERVSTPEPLAKLCADRAGVELGTWKAAINGMIIEQQQIITTQNLAAVFSTFDLTDALRPQLGDMARQCFTWVCRRQQIKIDTRHAEMIMVKNTAYAWRQMIFYLSLLPNDRIVDFLRWAERHFNEQPEKFRDRFRPALNGLALVVEGGSLDDKSARDLGARRFLGWSEKRHWLLSSARRNLI